MKANQIAKQDVIKSIESNISKAKSILVWQYEGLDVKAMTRVRSELNKQNVKVFVYKNTLANIAFKNQGIDIKKANQELTGQNAFIFSMEDETAGPRVIGKFKKEFDKIQYKLGVIDKEILTAEQVAKISKLESKEVLLAKLLGALQSPLQIFAATASALAKTKTE